MLELGCASVSEKPLIDQPIVKTYVVINKICNYFQQFYPRVDIRYCTEKQAEVNLIFSVIITFA
jgi:hypothetical protein